MLIIYCSDHRLKKANLWKHIKSHLIPPDQRWTSIGVLGGPISLARPADLPVDFAFLLGQIEFVLGEFKPTGIVLVGHDCGYYGRFTKHPVGIGEKKGDIRKAAELLAAKFSLPVKGFFKKPGLGFEQIFW